MDYLTERLDERLDVTRLLPGARAVIVVADQYARPGDDPPAADPAPPPGDPAQPTGRVARYARGRDYHRVINKRLHALADRLRELHPAAEFRAFVDSGPALEREHALRARLDQHGAPVFIGRHTLVIHPRLGSYLLLGGLATTLDLAPPDPAPVPPRADHCGACRRCIDACPTGAIAPAGDHVDATRCISYLTLEHRARINPALHAPMADHLLGCDICQDVCPFNDPAVSPSSAALATVNPAYADAAGLRARLPILDVLGWTPDDRARVLSGSAAKRATLDMLRRSAVIAAANHLAAQPRGPAAPRLRTALESIAREDSLPGLTARDALAAATPGEPSAEA